MRKRRADGLAAADVPAYRRIMPYLMRGRNESAVYFEQLVDLTKSNPYIETFNTANAPLRITPFHLVLWGMVQAFQSYPHMNRFVAGGRVYDRDGIWISYSAKREMKQGAPLVVVKRRFDPEQSFLEMITEMSAQLSDSRADEDSPTDKELKLVLRAPGAALRGLMALERAADAMGLLPTRFIRNDPMFASAFVANLGSLGMDAPFHHLYEYGTISIFCAIGQAKELPRVIDGRTESRMVLPLRFTFDERIEDGMYAHAALEHLRGIVEDPEGAGGIGRGDSR